MFYISFDILDKLNLDDQPFQFTELQAEADLDANVPALVAREWRYCKDNKAKAVEIICVNTLCNAYYAAGQIEKSKIFADQYYKLMAEVEKMAEADALEIFEIID